MSKSNKNKVKHFKKVKDFLKKHGEIVPNTNFMHCYSFKTKSIDLKLGEFLNGTGSFISSPTLIVVHYEKLNKIVKKEGFYKELEHYSNNLENIFIIKNLIFEKVV
jgi:hypothetical protein